LVAEASARFEETTVSDGRCNRVGERESARLVLTRSISAINVVLGSRSTSSPVFRRQRPRLRPSLRAERRSPVLGSRRSRSPASHVPVVNVGCPFSSRRSSGSTEGGPGSLPARRRRLLLCSAAEPFELGPDAAGAPVVLGDRLVRVAAKLEERPHQHE